CRARASGSRRTARRASSSRCSRTFTRFRSTTTTRSADGPPIRRPLRQRPLPRRTSTAASAAVAVTIDSFDRRRRAPPRYRMAPMTLDERAAGPRSGLVAASALARGLHKERSPNGFEIEEREERDDDQVYL